MRTIAVWIVAAVAMLLCWSGPALARVGWSEFASLSPEMRACMAGKVDGELLSVLEQGERPGSSSDRKKAQNAYRACLAETAGASGPELAPYDGPFFDAMAQIDDSVDMDEAVRLIRQSGVEGVALFARSRKRLHDDEKDVLELAADNPGLFVLGAPKFFRLSGDLRDDYIQATLDGIDRHGYRFVGEILYTHGDKKSGKQYAMGERYVDPLKPGTAKLLQGIASRNVPLMTHWEVYDQKRDAPRFHDLYAAWPEQVFIVPHLGFGSAAQASEFLDAHPNVVMTISKKDRLMNDFSSSEKQASIGSPMLDGMKLRPEWRAFLIRYQDRLMAATDAHMKKLWARYPERVASQRLVLGQIDREAAEKIAFENARRVYGLEQRK